MNKPNLTLTPTEIKELGHLISWCVEGPSHGFQNSTQWKDNLKQLVKFCTDRGIPVGGQWATL